MPEGIPSVKFADNDLLNKLGFNVPNAGAKAPAPRAPMSDFSPDAPPDIRPNPADTFAMPETPTSMPAASAPIPPILPQTPPSTPAPQAQPPVDSNLDSPNLAFSSTLANLSVKQRAIVDDMCERLSFKDLFTMHRFKIDFTIIPGQLQVTFQSMTQQELSDFWTELVDVKGSSMYIEALMALKYCSRTVVALNKKALSEEVADREALFNGFDHAFVQAIFDYAKLFEIARMKFLHRSHFGANPT